MTKAMKWLRWAMCLVAAVCCLWGAGLQAATFDDVTVTELAVPRPAYHQHGYVEYRFVLFNSSPGRTHQVTLRIPGESWGMSGSVSRTVTLAPQAQARMSLWMPMTSYNGQGVRVLINGVRQDGNIPIDTPDQGHYYSSFTKQVLVSQEVDSRFRDEMTSILQDIHSSSSSVEFGVRTTMPVAQWSESWLGYSSFDGIVMTQREWASAPESVRQAIMGSVEAGGSLLVVGQFTAPARWQNRLSSWQEYQSGLRVSHVMLGRVGQIPAERLLGWTQSQYQANEKALWEPVSATQNVQLAISDANNAFSVTDSLGVPTRGMLAIMMLFAILIGPVNMFVFARYNKRLWIFVTIPLAALVFSLGVFGYTIVADGINAWGRASSLTILDQRQGHATTLAWLGYYAPLQPSDGFMFDEDTEITPQTGDDTWGYSRSEAASHVVDWSQGQHLASGWISARVPTHLVVRKSQARREKLVVSRADDGTITVVNGLGSDIHRLALADEKGNVHYARDIPAGQQVKLSTQSESSHETTFAPMTNAISVESWRRDPAALTAAHRLTPNSYHAALAEPVFIQQGLSRMKQLTSESVVYGLYTFENQGE